MIPFVLVALAGLWTASGALVWLTIRLIHAESLWALVSIFFGIIAVLLAAFLTHRLFKHGFPN